MWRRCSLAVLLADFLGLSFLLLMLNYLVVQHFCSPQQEIQSFVDHSQFFIPSSSPQQGGAVLVHSELPVTGGGHGTEQCTMSTCFDVTKCRVKGEHHFKVYVYPSPEGVKKSKLFDKILSTIRTSPFMTSDPHEACLFVPSIDVLDRDVHSKDYFKNLPPLSSLPYWNGGRNHLLFIQYSGTWPKYSERLDFSTGQAILARASFNTSLYRDGFDVSLPLMHKDHPTHSDRSGVLSHSGMCGLFPVHRKYLLAFKGKRYLYGQGSGIRSSLYHIHNGRDVVMVTTCKHNQDWIKYTDERCNSDNLLYESYDFEDLMKNSSFCLIPRGRRLGSFRFLEALQSSCIPVSLSNGYVLPFSEIIDWTKSSIVFDERQMLQVPYILRRTSSSSILQLRLNTQFVWESYFSSLHKIIMTTFKIIGDRIEVQPNYLWNTPPHPVHLHTDFSPYPRDYPHNEVWAHGGAEPRTTDSVNATSLHSLLPALFTATISAGRAATRDSSPLMKLVRVLSRSAHLAAVVILWVGSGPPQIMRTKFPGHVMVEVVDMADHVTDVLGIHSKINTSAILHLNEDVFLTEDEVDFGFSVWQAFPSRLVGFVGHSHSWDSVRLKWAYSAKPHNYVSMVTTDALFYHKYYGYLLSTSLSANTRRIAQQSLTCLNIVLNCLVAHHAQAPPIKLPWTRHAPSSAGQSLEVSRERVSCLNMAANAFGYMPLKHSLVRFDPVLYKDNVSMLRKEYRKMEVPSN